MLAQPRPVLFLQQALEPAVLDAAGCRQVAVGAQKLFDFPVGRVVYPLAQGLQQQIGIERIVPQLCFQRFEARMVTAGKRRLRLVILAALLGETVGMRWLTDRQQYSAQQAGEAGQVSSQ